MTTFACVLCRYVAKRLLREAIQPENNVAAFLEDTNAHREAAALASAFGSRCKLHYVGAQMQYGPVYIVQIPCMVRLIPLLSQLKPAVLCLASGTIHANEDVIC